MTTPVQNITYSSRLRMCMYITRVPTKPRIRQKTGRMYTYGFGSAVARPVASRACDGATEPELIDRCTARRDSCRATEWHEMTAGARGFHFISVAVCALLHCSAPFLS